MDGRWRKPAFDRVIVFDLDDTLYLERNYVESGLRAVGAWARARMGLGDLESLMLSRFAAGNRVHIFDDSLIAAGVDPAPALIARMLNVYRQHRPAIDLEGDVEAYLNDRPAGTGYAIITDGFIDAQRRKLRALNLYRRGIRLGICTDRWGRDAWKPSPRAFVQAQEYFGLGPEHFTYVADNPAKDFHAPLMLGWSTVRIVRPGSLHEKTASVETACAHRVIASLGEL